MDMELAIPRGRLLELVSTQVRNNFLIEPDEQETLARFMDEALERLEVCFAASPNKYYWKDARVFFSPYHSAQYCIFLYLLSNTLHRHNAGGVLADKLYYLNKLLNALDLFYEVELPAVFFTDHPVGTVLGRAQYGEYFSFAQNCTVGNNKGHYPVIGSNVSMFSGSMILGNSRVGDFSSIGAGAIVKDQDVPPHTVVFGSSPNLVFKNRQKIL